MSISNTTSSALNERQIVSRRDSKLLDRLGQFADERGVQLYAVGGYVRDRLLGAKVKDIDFTVLGSAVDFATELATHLNVNPPVVFPKFGTAMLPYRDYQLDFVSARSESYDSESRKPAVVPGSLKHDLERRDFTVNALAIGLNEDNYGLLIDQFGGVDDLKKKVLRTPLNPEQTFSEDPLRIMRAIRFASQLHFGIEPATLAALSKMASRLKIVSQERITDEFLKLLATDTPSMGLRLMYVSGVLDVVFPEIATMSGVEQVGPHHHKDVFDHTLQVVDQIAQLTSDPYLRLAALVHDIAKPRTKRFMPDLGWTFHGHEDVGARMMKPIGRRLRLPEKQSEKISKLVALHMRPINLTREDVTDSAVRRLIVDAGEDLEDLLTLCRADITTANPKKVKRYLRQFESLEERIHDVIETDKMRAFQSPVRGDEIMAVCNIGPGPLVGRIKAELEDAILDGRIPNEHDAVLAYLHEIKSKYL